MKLLELDHSRIDIWASPIEKVINQGIVREYLDLLSPEERLINDRLHFPLDRWRYLVTRVLVRTTLSRYYPLAPKDWVFAAGRHGKPLISGTDSRASQICFNISHTDGLILLGVAHDMELGVDVENCREVGPSAAIAGRFFSRHEVTELRALSFAKRQERFIEYWTLKESYIKARGRGLSIALDQVSFRFPSERTISVALNARLNDCHSRWRFWQFRANEEHVAAVCAERTTNVIPQLKARKITPLISEEPFEIHEIKTSEQQPSGG